MALTVPNNLLSFTVIFAATVGLHAESTVEWVPLLISPGFHHIHPTLVLVAWPQNTDWGNWQTVCQGIDLLREAVCI